MPRDASVRNPILTVSESFDAYIVSTHLREREENPDNGGNARPSEFAFRGVILFRRGQSSQLSATSKGMQLNSAASVNRSARAQSNTEAMFLTG